MALQIRLATADDAAPVAAIYAPFVRETVISFELEPPTPAEMQRRIAKTLPRYPWLVCEHDTAIVGYVYAGQHRERPAYQWSVDVTAYVALGQHRRGIGRALYTALFAALAAQGFYNAYAGVTLPNAASVGLHEAIGFTPVGVYRNVGYKFDRWHNVGWWQRSLQPPAPAPTAPKMLHEIIGTAACTAAIATGAALLRG